MSKSEDFTEGLFDERLALLRQRISEETEGAREFVSQFDPKTELRFDHPKDGPHTRTVEALLRMIDSYQSIFESAATKALGDEGDESADSIEYLQDAASVLLFELEAISKAIEYSPEEAWQKQ